MNVTGVPGQMGLAEALMVTSTLLRGFTVTVYATLGPVQVPKNGLITYVTVSSMVFVLVSTWFIVSPFPAE